MQFHGVLDGELLVIRDGAVAPFADLQQRLNRKAVSPKMQQRFPVGIHLYDLLFDGDRRPPPAAVRWRRARLEDWVARQKPVRMDLSPLIRFDSSRS